MIGDCLQWHAHVCVRVYARLFDCLQWHAIYLAAVVDVLAAHHLVLPLRLQQLFESYTQVLGEVSLGNALDDPTAVGVAGRGLVALL